MRNRTRHLVSGGNIFSYISYSNCYLVMSEDEPVDGPNGDIAKRRLRK